MLSTRQVSEMLGCSRSTVQRAAARTGVGRLVGAQFVFSPAEVKRLRRAVHRQAGNPKMIPGSRYCRETGRVGGQSKKVAAAK